jgi:hypothetical protein
MYERADVTCDINLWKSDVVIIILEQLNSNLTSRYDNNMTLV